MKTAISISDAVFHAAEQAAKRLDMTRSELYTKAVRAFLDVHQAAGVTEKLTEVYSQEPSRLDPGLVRMQAASLPVEEW